MSASCPVEGCDFSGATEQIFGHIGGRSDPFHGAVGSPDLLGERESEGLSSRAILLMIVLIATSGILVLRALEAEESGSVDLGTSDEVSESDERKGSKGPSEGLRAGRVEVD